MQRRGVRVTVVSSHSTQPSMIADELRRQADQFVDLKELRDILGRPSNGADDDEPVDAGYEDHLTE